MNILVIGNGFDLAHGLPTKYTDFLEVVKVIKQALREDKLARIDWGNINAEVKKLLITNKGKIQENLFSNRQTWEDLIDNNIWIEYFLSIYLDRQKEGKDGWIDFECEISEVIKSLNDDMKSSISQCFTLDDKIQRITHEFLNYKYSDWFAKRTYRELRDTLLTDLNKLIRALEIYLTEYVGKIEVEVISPDIKKISPLLYEDRSPQGALYSKVISFNYTNLYEQIYMKNHNINSEDYIDYIHGKTDSNNTMDTNNMVLGIDEYLKKKKRNKQVEFIAFKKFYQRIHKGTGCKHKEWIDTIKEEFADYQTELEKSKTERNIMNLKVAVNNLKKQYLNKHHVYIFGHSLDVTDKDILRDLILNDNVHTTIFYHNKDAMGQQIANLVKVIGQDELIRRTGGKDKLIEFRQQQPMIKRVKEDVSSVIGTD